MICTYGDTPLARAKNKAETCCRLNKDPIASSQTLTFEDYLSSNRFPPQVISVEPMIMYLIYGLLAISANVVGAMGSHLYSKHQFDGGADAQAA